MGPIVPQKASASFVEPHPSSPPLSAQNGLPRRHFCLVPSERSFAAKMTNEDEDSNQWAGSRLFGSAVARRVACRAGHESRPCRGRAKSEDCSARTVEQHHSEGGGSPRNRALCRWRRHGIKFGASVSPPARCLRFLKPGVQIPLQFVDFGSDILATPHASQPHSRFCWPASMFRDSEPVLGRGPSRRTCLVTPRARNVVRNPRDLGLKCFKREASSCSIGT